MATRIGTRSERKNEERRTQAKQIALAQNKRKTRQKKMANSSEE